LDDFTSPHEVYDVTYSEERLIVFNKKENLKERINYLRSMLLTAMMDEQRKELQQAKNRIKHYKLQVNEPPIINQ
jgi:hypothetical protein